MVVSNACQQWIEQSVGSEYLLAYSGGMDSHVLLHAMASLRSQAPFSLRALHINHQLSPNADTWERHCEQIAKSLEVQFLSIKVDIPHKTKNIENACREARYGAIEKIIRPGERVLMAHHANDQAETLLQRILSGSGIKGMGSMGAVRKMGCGQVIRPFLSLPREVLEEYANAHGLQWIEDESNQATHLSRNYLRHEIIPLLESHWPGAIKSMHRAARFCYEADSLLEEFIEDLSSSMIDEDTKTLSIPALRCVSRVKQTYILRLWLRQNHLPLPNSKKVDAILDQVFKAKQDRVPCVSWEGGEVRRYQEKLYALKPRFITEKPPQVWEMKNPMTLPCGRILSAQKGKGIKPLEVVTVVYRREGEAMRVNGCRRPLKKLMQEWQIPPWERSHIPLLMHHDEVIAVVGYAVADHWQDPAGWAVLID